MGKEHAAHGKGACCPKVRINLPMGKALFPAPGGSISRTSGSYGNTSRSSRNTSRSEGQYEPFGRSVRAARRGCASGST